VSAKKRKKAAGGGDLEELINEAKKEEENAMVFEMIDDLAGAHEDICCCPWREIRLQLYKQSNG